ncbi:hypothetical protein F5Y10DRAFT_244447 [Nemania abortiva]|nr:hypothetical protein F5Y10DRAFT_244447 [Nemania abortiva]
MFPIDVTMLPALTTRKALLVVDAQNDFLAEDGALPVKMPIDLPERISNLANEFRRNGGEIIWVQSRFESPRALDEEQILASDLPGPSAGATPARGRRSRTTPPATEPAVSPEAFLTPGPGKGPRCVRAGTPGAEMHPVVKQAVGSKDHILTKTFYSAFRADELLRLLRVRFVTELFICGSLTNIGVMATAIDAASYGYTITIVDDCCGSQSMSRHRMALRQITNTTGCDTLSAANVLGTIRPRPTTSERVDQSQYRGAAGRSPTVRVQRGRKDAASDIQSSLERLSLSGEPAAADEHASTISPSQRKQQHRQQEHQPQSQPQSQLRPRLRSQSQSQSQSQHQSQSPSPSAVQSLARPDHPQTKRKTDRDTITPQGTGSAAPSSRISAALGQSARDGGGGGSKSPDSDGSESGKSDEAVGADPPTWGSVSSSNRRSQPPSAALPLPELRPKDCVDVGNNANVDINKERDMSTMISDRNSPASSRSEYESLETPPTPTYMTPEDDTEALPPSQPPQPPQSSSDKDPFSSKYRRNKKINTMTPPQDAHRMESDPLCEGDTKVIYDILPEPLAEDIFERIQAEVDWQRMSHQGGEVPRLVAVQGYVEADGSKPVYRHPSDESPPLRPFTAAVDEIRRAAEARLGHPLNHALIQLYRHGHDYISEHSDKTLDIARGSFIVNVSLGAERTMTLRTKRPPKDSEKPRDSESAENLKRQVQRARLPHNSLFQMGLTTNMRWMHSIRQDRRLVAEKSDAERAYGGSRISLTFRHIATFLDADEALIWGQGATAKTRVSACAVVNGQTDSAVAMLRAFGRENQSTEFNWDAHYGRGFDVLHISTAPRLFLSEEDTVVNTRLQIMLAEMGISYSRGSVSTKTETQTGKMPSDIDVPVKFVDNDEAKTAVVGQRNIMLYLQKIYGGKLPDTECVRKRFQEALGFLNSWRALSSSTPPSTPAGEEGEEVATAITNLLAPWEQYAVEDTFIAGPKPSLADFAFWPVLRDILSSSVFSSSIPSDKRDEVDVEGGPKLPNLQAYHKRMLARDAVARVLG